jgi:hypothetical protein
MKTIRSLLTLVAMSMVLFALGTAEAKARVFDTVSFEGSVTLPLDTQWGAMRLPAGEYKVLLGSNDFGFKFVEVRDKAKGSLHGMILAGPFGDTSATKNALVCVRKDNLLIVRTLELPTLGHRVSFRNHRGEHLLARNRNRGTNMQLAEVPELTQRIPVKMTAK